MPNKCGKNENMGQVCNKKEIKEREKVEVELCKKQNEEKKQKKKKNPKKQVPGHILGRVIFVP